MLSLKSNNIIQFLYLRPMKASIVIVALALISASHAVAASDNNASNPKNTAKETRIEKNKVPGIQDHLLKLFVFDATKVNLKRDTSLTNNIKPDFSSLVLPENKLWFRNHENLVK